MIPANESLETEDHSVHSRLWLVMDKELTVGNGRAQITLKGVPFPLLRVHVVVKESYCVTPIDLGTIQSGIGVAEKRCDIAPIARIDGPPHAEAYLDALPANLKFLRDSFKQPIGERGRSRRARA